MDATALEKKPPAPVNNESHNPPGNVVDRRSYQEQRQTQLSPNAEPSMQTPHWVAKNERQLVEKTAVHATQAGYPTTPHETSANKTDVLNKLAEFGGEVLDNTGDYIGASLTDIVEESHIQQHNKVTSDKGKTNKFSISAAFNRLLRKKPA